VRWVSFSCRAGEWRIGGADLIAEGGSLIHPIARAVGPAADLLEGRQTARPASVSL
jgi:hypothetical protein